MGIWRFAGDLAVELRQKKKREQSPLSAILPPMRIGVCYGLGNCRAKLFQLFSRINAVNSSVSF